MIKPYNEHDFRVGLPCLPIHRYACDAVLVLMLLFFLQFIIIIIIIFCLNISWPQRSMFVTLSHTNNNIHVGLQCSMFYWKFIKHFHSQPLLWLSFIFCNIDWVLLNAVSNSHSTEKQTWKCSMYMYCMYLLAVLFQLFPKLIITDSYHFSIVREYSKSTFTIICMYYYPQSLDSISILHS